MTTLSALIVVHNEEQQLVDCLSGLHFVDEIIVLLDRCTDKSAEIARTFTKYLFPGIWPVEGDRRNAGITACHGLWIIEIDADERIDYLLSSEVLTTITRSSCNIYKIPVDNYIGRRRIQHGWGASYGKSAYSGLFQKGSKVWGRQRLHPTLTYYGTHGAFLKNTLRHNVDRDIHDMIARLNSYTSMRACDIQEKGIQETLLVNCRRFLSRFFKCFILRKGYKEGSYGFLTALFSGMYPLLSYFKAVLEQEDG